MATIYRLGKRYKKNKIKYRPKSRHYNDLLDRVKNYVLNCENEFVFKEIIAEELGVKVRLVSRCLQLLNIERLVSQPRRKQAHDSNRDLFSFGDSGWAADIYYINKDKL